MKDVLSPKYATSFPAAIMSDLKKTSCWFLDSTQTNLYPSQQYYCSNYTCHAESNILFYLSRCFCVVVVMRVCLRIERLAKRTLILVIEYVQI